MTITTFKIINEKRNNRRSFMLIRKVLLRLRSDTREEELSETDSNDAIPAGI